MKVRNTGKREEKIELQMTPMIDIVFQLLVFFIMTFKIVQVEGDFNIRMPLNAPREGLPDENQLPPMKVKLRADSEGELASIRLNERGFGDFEALRGHVAGVIGNERGPNSIQESAEIELDCDFNLHYKYVIEAITAVSGYINKDNEVVRMVEKIKFSEPKVPG